MNTSTIPFPDPSHLRTAFGQVFLAAVDAILQLEGTLPWWVHGREEELRITKGNRVAALTLHSDGSFSESTGIPEAGAISFGGRYLSEEDFRNPAKYAKRFLALVETAK